MPASTLHYGTPLAQAVGGTGTFLDLMDAIHAIFTAATKWDVASTVGGAGARQVIEVSPSGGTITAQRAVFAGAASGSSLMQSPDSFLSNALLVGYGPDGGTFVGSSWATATPNLYGANRQIPFSRATAAATDFNQVVLFESADDFVLMVKTATPAWYACRVGAWMRTPIQAESESSTYCLQGLWTNGSTAVSGTWAASNEFWTSHRAVNGSAHAYVMEPGTSNVLEVTRCAIFDGVVRDSTGAGNRLYMPLGNYRYGTRVMGEARESYFASAQWRTIAQDASGNQFLLFGASSSSNVDAVAFKV